MRKVGFTIEFGKTEDEKDPYYKADYNASVGNRDTFTRDLYEKMYDRKLAAIDEQLKSKKSEAKRE